MKVWSSPFVLTVISVVAIALLLLVAIGVYEWSSESPTEPNQRILGVSELFGALAAVIGIPLLVIQLTQLKGGLLTANEARKLIETDLQEKANELKKHMLEWFSPDASREKGDFKVEIFLDPDPSSWLKVVEGWLRHWKSKPKDWPSEEKNYYFIEHDKQKRDAIRARWGKAWVVCFSTSSRRFTNKDAETLGNKLKSSDISAVLGNFDMHGKLQARFSDHQRGTD